MEDHAEKCVESFCESAKKRCAPNTSDDHETTGELSAICAQIVQKCLYLASIGRPDLLWSVSTLARSVNKACDKRLLRLINYINQTKNYWQFCHVDTKWKIANSVFSPTHLG